jgi:hypothetical protein
MCLSLPCGELSFEFLVRDHKSPTVCALSPFIATFYKLRADLCLAPILNELRTMLVHEASSVNHLTKSAGSLNGILNIDE